MFGQTLHLRCSLPIAAMNFSDILVAAQVPPQCVDQLINLWLDCGSFCFVCHLIGRFRFGYAGAV